MKLSRLQPNCSKKDARCMRYISNSSPRRKSFASTHLNHSANKLSLSLARMTLSRRIRTYKTNSLLSVSFCRRISPNARRLSNDSVKKKKHMLRRKKPSKVQPRSCRPWTLDWGAEEESEKVPDEGCLPTQVWGFLGKSAHHILIRVPRNGRHSQSVTPHLFSYNTLKKSNDDRIR